MKDIAILVSLYPPKWIGGTEVATEELVDKLRKKGYEIDVITSQREGRFKMLKYVLDGMKQLKQEEYSTIHCQSIFPALIPYLLKKKYFVYCRGSDVMLTKGWRKWLNKKLLMKAEKVIALTRAMQNKLKQDYRVESVVIPNAIDTFDCNVEKIPGQIIFVGTLKEVKGINYLLEALKMIEENISLIIVGDGPERNYLERYASELGLTSRVKFVGMKNKLEIQKYICESQILVLPSLSEGFSMTLLEAMVGGIPVIATNVGGNPEIIEDRINGFLVEPRNPRQIANSIQWLLEDKELMRLIGLNNQYNVKKYSWDNLIYKLKEVWYGGQKHLYSLNCN